MATTVAQDRAFNEAVISRVLLEDAVGWIQSNLTPQEVFSIEQLEGWAKDNGFVVPEDPT